MYKLFDMFPDEDSARKWFEEARWPDGRACVKCGSINTSVVPNDKPMPYWCPDCRSYFSVKFGTVMQGSNLPMRKWAIAIYLVTTNLKGVSRHEASPRPGDCSKERLAHAPPYPQGHAGAVILCSMGLSKPMKPFSGARKPTSTRARSSTLAGRLARRPSWE